MQGVKFTGDGYTHCKGKYFRWDGIVNFGFMFGCINHQWPSSQVWLQFSVI